MTAARPMSALRRPMPGMPATDPAAKRSSEPASLPADPQAELAALARPRRRRRVDEPRSARRAEDGAGRRVTADYSTTRLVNFRLPVELHDHCRELVRGVEQTDPRLRRPSLTEVIIALLEEGPHTPEGIAELLRRRRAAENEREAVR